MATNSLPRGGVTSQQPESRAPAATRSDPIDLTLGSDDDDDDEAETASRPALAAANAARSTAVSLPLPLPLPLPAAAASAGPPPLRATGSAQPAPRQVHQFSEARPPPADQLPPAGKAGDRLTLFTDGSWKHGLSGAGVAYAHNGAWFGRSVALGRTENNDVAEMEAIRHALSIASAVAPHIGASEVVIASDCMDCIEALKGLHDPDHLRAICQTTLLEKAALDFEVKLHWVRAHNYVAGNERADMLAKHGRSRTETYGHVNQINENPIGDELDEGMREVARLASLDNRDLVITAATGPPLNPRYSQHRQPPQQPGRIFPQPAAQRHQQKQAHRHSQNQQARP
ncbi:hypothetical protein BST61_g3852 [Cercospora zeina]